MANALMGLNRALKDYVHAGALAGRSGPDTADGVLAQGRAAFDLLERGLADYHAARR